MITDGVDSPARCTAAASNERWSLASPPVPDSVFRTTTRSAPFRFDPFVPSRANAAWFVQPRARTADLRDPPSSPLFMTPSRVYEDACLHADVHRPPRG